MANKQWLLSPTHRAPPPSSGRRCEYSSSSSGGSSGVGFRQGFEDGGAFASSLGKSVARVEEALSARFWTSVTTSGLARDGRCRWRGVRCRGSATTPRWGRGKG